MKTIKTILHPTDLSELSQEALALAGSLARDRCARLVILHVTPITPAIAPLDEAAPKHKLDHSFVDLKSYQQDMLARLERLDLPAVPGMVECLLEQGEPARIILRKADDIACDLIVMGTHGRTGQLKQLMGSVAEEVMRKAPCPVVVIKMPER